MKYIEKEDEPSAFTDWKSLANEDWQPTYTDLPGDIKAPVKRALANEQGSICCYCERRLTDVDSHIEHFRPQSDPAVDPLDFNNMLCSCQNRLKKGEPRHCGNLKEDWFDKDLLISPLNPGCETFFAYSADGEIRPANQIDEAAKTTIMKLGLNIDKLIDLRKNAIAPFLDDSLSDADCISFIEGYLKRNSDGLFPEFFTTFRHLFAS